MLWRKTQTAFKSTEDSEEVFSSLPILRPVPQFIPERPSLDEYERAAKELGFIPGKLIEAQILQFLSQQKIPIFDNLKVDAYLIRKATEQHKLWIWRPLRQKDKPRGWHWDGAQPREYHYRDTPYVCFGSHGSYYNEWSFRPYDKAVPMQILKEVKAIEECVPTALFFVSDYAVPVPDPFIMVTQLDVKKIIFDVWNEPDFGI